MHTIRCAFIPQVNEPCRDQLLEEKALMQAGEEEYLITIQLTITTLEVWRPFSTTEKIYISLPKEFSTLQLQNQYFQDDVFMASL